MLAPSPCPANVAGQDAICKDLSLKARHPSVFLQSGEAPQLDLGVNVNGEKIDDTHFELVLTIKATAKVEEKIMFDLELDYAGIFVPENT